VFAILSLTHYHAFDRCDDRDMLEKLKSALWFVMEPLMTKNDNFSFGFYKSMLEKLKMFKDKTNPEDEQLNYVSASGNAIEYF
jgi:sister-chromatid-cohesion protein PDS5